MYDLNVILTLCCALRYLLKSDKAPIPIISFFSKVFIVSNSILEAVRKCFSLNKASNFSGVSLNSSLQMMWEYILKSFFFKKKKYIYIIKHTYIWSNIRIISLCCWLRNHNWRRSERFDMKISLHDLSCTFISLTLSWESNI